MSPENEVHPKAAPDFYIGGGQDGKRPICVNISHIISQTEKSSATFVWWKLITNLFFENITLLISWKKKKSSKWRHSFKSIILYTLWQTLVIITGTYSWQKNCSTWHQGISLQYIRFLQHHSLKVQIVKHRKPICSMSHKIFHKFKRFLWDLDMGYESCMVFPPHLFWNNITKGIE